MPNIALFIHNPEASRRCCYGIMKALGQHYNIKLFSEEQFNASTLDGIDIVAFPGGVGDADRYYDFFKRRQANIVADYVANGGRYLGICMGAYWAGSHYFDILDGIDTVQYIKRPTADIKRSYITVAPVLWQGQVENMFFWDGCTYTGQGKFTTVASYANRDPMAIIQNRVGLIGAHPESLLSWYDKPYLKPHWHHGQHHQLLLNFVNRLMLS